MTAEPELLVKEMTREDNFIVIASVRVRVRLGLGLGLGLGLANPNPNPNPNQDGVWEFLTNQSVADMVLKFDDPLEACRAVVAESYRLWLQYEVRADGIITSP